MIIIMNIQRFLWKTDYDDDIKIGNTQVTHNKN